MCQNLQNANAKRGQTPGNDVLRKKPMRLQRNKAEWNVFDVCLKIHYRSTDDASFVAVMIRPADPNSSCQLIEYSRHCLRSEGVGCFISTQHCFWSKKACYT